MSQAAVMKDNLASLRKKSLTQEQIIDKTTWLKKWQRSDATKTLFIEKILALVFLPLAILWTLLISVILFGMGVCLFVFRSMARIFR